MGPVTKTGFFGKRRSAFTFTDALCGDTCFLDESLPRIPAGLTHCQPDRTERRAGFSYVAGKDLPALRLKD